MKKNILLILLVASASSSVLFAQNGNRLKATNQVTGYRLQALSREQGTENRLQGAGLERTELLSEDPIGQQSEITANCYLMMNPEEILNLKAAEEGLGKNTHTVETSLAFSSSGVAEGSEFTEIPNNITSCNLFTEQSIKSPSEAETKKIPWNWLRAIKAVLVVSLVTHEAWGAYSNPTWHESRIQPLCNILEDQLPNLFSEKKITVSLPWNSDWEVCNNAREKEALEPQTWTHGRSTTEEIDFVERNTMERMTTEKKLTITGQIILLKDVASERSAKAMRANGVGQVGEKYNWNQAAIAFYNATEKLEKALEAQVNGNSQESEGWREVAEHYQYAGEFFTEAAIANSLWNKALVDNWTHAARNSASAADNLGKAIEAAGNQNLKEAEQLEQIARQQQGSVEFFVAAADAFAVINEVTIEEGKNWNSAGNGFCLAANSLEKAIFAETNKQQKIAEQWRYIAEQHEHSVERYAHAARAYSEGKKAEAVSWHYVGQGFYKVADRMGRAIEAESAGKSKEAEEWRQVVEQQQRSIEFFMEAIKAYLEGKKVEGASWYYAGSGFYWSANSLDKAIWEEINGKQNVAEEWRQAAKQHERSVKPFTAAAKAYVTENRSERKRLYLQGQMARAKANQLEKKAWLAGSERFFGNPYEKASDYWLKEREAPEGE